MKISFFKILFALVFSLLPFVASAGSGSNMSGWAWSSNIGWISFNSTNDNDGATAGVQPSAIDYGVNKDGSGYLVGYAWSSNIGWIQFGGLSGFPVAAGTTASNAQVVGSSLVGWAKAINTGDDGWISLTGTGYGVTVSGTNFTGYAWASDTLGWTQFYNVTVGSVSPTGPDLTASAVSPTTATPGVAQTYSSIISNGGNTATGASFSNFFQTATLPNGGGTVTDLASSSMNAIASGGNATATSPSVTFASGATPSIRACADGTSSAGGGLITESDETNNCGPWTNVVVSSACVVNQGSACVSSANSCGQTNSGTIQCDGSCSASTPSNNSCVINGQCSAPASHLNPCSSGTAGTITNGISSWTWSCIGSGTGHTDASCTEQKKIPKPVEG